MVYLGWMLSRRIVALKLVHAELARQELFRERFCGRWRLPGRPVGVDSARPGRRHRDRSAVGGDRARGRTSLDSITDEGCGPIPTTAVRALGHQVAGVDQVQASLLLPSCGLGGIDQRLVLSAERRCQRPAHWPDSGQGVDDLGKRERVRPGRASTATAPQRAYEPAVCRFARPDISAARLPREEGSGIAGVTLGPGRALQRHREGAVRVTEERERAISLTTPSGCRGRSTGCRVRQRSPSVISRRAEGLWTMALVGSAGGSGSRAHRRTRPGGGPRTTARRADRRWHQGDGLPAGCALQPRPASRRPGVRTVRAAPEQPPVRRRRRHLADPGHAQPHLEPGRRPGGQAPTPR